MRGFAVVLAFVHDSGLETVGHLLLVRIKSVTTNRSIDAELVQRFLCGGFQFAETGIQIAVQIECHLYRFVERLE